jgi:SAM-dependent methyltransferase
LPFSTAFDVVVCLGALGHILPREEPRFVAEVARVLKPGGRFVFVTANPPPYWSVKHWGCRLFNAAMHLRNLLVEPPFVMYYLTFLLPDVKSLLRRHGLEVRVQDLRMAEPFSRLKLVMGVRLPRSGAV